MTAAGNVVPITPDDNVEPQDQAAERAVLGAILISAAAYQTATGIITAADFFNDHHRTIWDAAAHIRRAGKTPDEITIKARLEETGDLKRIGGWLYLHSLVEMVPSASNVDHYAGIVRERAVRRRLATAGRRIVQLAYQPEEAHALTETAAGLINQVREAGMADEDIATMTIEEFMNIDDAPYDWVVPGLLERGDRFVLTGMEGAGKSTLFRQMAVTIAAGIHPFTAERIPPRKVLMIDCENGDRHTRRKSRSMYHQAIDIGHPSFKTNLWVELRPDGMDLTSDRDLSWLLRRIVAIQPDVLAIGPFYKMHRGHDASEERTAVKILGALDLVRANGSCVLLEAHAGHATGRSGLRDLRPRGSSALLGWPEFGYGLRLVPADEESTAPVRRLAELVPWRGDRDERHWPTRMERGNDWPWAEAPDGSYSNFKGAR